MNIILNNINKWLEVYGHLDDDEQYQYLLETINYEIPDDYLGNIKFQDIIIDTFRDLIATKQYEKMEKMYNKAYRLKDNFDGWYFADSYTIDYYLYNSDNAEVKRRLDSFLANPIKSIDEFVPLFNKLVFYGYSDLSLDISLYMYDKVKNAPGLIAGVESVSVFNKVIYGEKLQSIYNDSKKNIPIHKNKVVKYLKRYNYDLSTYINKTVMVLSPKYEKMPNTNDFYKKRMDSLHIFMLMFCRYMLDFKKVNFATSFDIWAAAFKSFKTIPTGRESEGNFNNAFRLNQTMYNNEISKRTKLAPCLYTSAYAVAWGMAYMYDFLYKHKYISDMVYNEALEIINVIKTELINKDIQTLWEYSYVHTWEKPDSMTDEEFNYEKILFNNSFKAHIKIVDDITFKRLLKENHNTCMKE